VPPIAAESSASQIAVRAGRAVPEDQVLPELLGDQENRAQVPQSRAVLAPSKDS